MSFQAFISELNTFCEYLGAPVIVALFYWFRFHSLEDTRSYTTLFLHSIGVATFVLPFLVVFCAIYYAVGNAEVFQLASRAHAISATSAICVVMLLWLVPALPKLWRDLCHRIARVPFCAYGVRTMLINSAWELRLADSPDISRKLARMGFQIEDLRATQSAPIQSRFLKIAAIMHHLEEWNLRGNAFLDRNREHYSEMLAAYDLLSFKAARTLKGTAAIYGAIMEENKVQPDDWHALDVLSAQNDSSNRLQAAAQNASGSMLEDLRKDMDFLLDHLLLLVARCALASEWSFAGRKRRLEAIGFTVTPPTHALVWMALHAVVLSVSTVLVWFFMIKNSAEYISGNLAAGEARSFLMSPLNIALNVAIVYHLKRNYAFANEGMFGGFPVRFILSIGVLTALLFFPLQAAFDYYQFPERDYANTIVHELPILLYIWATGAVVALLVQDSMWSGFSSRRARRVMDGIVFGATFVIAIALLVAINAVFPIPVMENMAQVGVVKMVFAIFGFSFVAGFILGFCLIAPVRQAASLRFARDELMSGAAPAYA